MPSVMRQRKWMPILIVLLSLMIGVLACGGSTDDESQNVREAPPTVEEVAEEDSQEEKSTETEDGGATVSGDAELVVENLANDSICFLYVSPSESTDWGDDQLGETTVIDPGDTWSVFDVPAGTYDLRAEMCEGDYVEEDGVVLDGEYTWTIFVEGATGDFMTITDDFGSVQLEVPVEWAETSGEPWYFDGDVIGAELIAAPDLDGFLETWDVPGVMFSVSDDLARLAGYLQLLDIMQDELLTDCEFDGRFDYEDTIYRGKYDLFKKCGGPGGAAYMVLSAVSKDDQFSYLILVETQMVSDSDRDVADHILDTFQVIGELP
jgi:hypothetical protein